jgi:sugar lactone lactonase YvrE
MKVHQQFMIVIRAVLICILLSLISGCPGKICDAGATLVMHHFAGSNNAGSTDGIGAATSFNSPNGITLDSSGNIYVVDTGNDTIRKITPAGAVTTIAGSAGVVGYMDGAASVATFNSPKGIIVDPIGNIYVADTLNHSIRKVTPIGVVSTFAGTPTVAGNADGNSVSANFNLPSGIALDSKGNLFVADTGNHLIRKISSAGVVTTLAGTAGVAGSTDGVGLGASFNSPLGVTVDAYGNVYVADTGNETIRKITTTGVVTTFAGSAGVVGNTDGTSPATSSFNSPRGISIDTSGLILYVADTGNNSIRQVSTVGNIYVTTWAVGAQNVLSVAIGDHVNYSTTPFGIVSWIREVLGCG